MRIPVLAALLVLSGCAAPVADGPPPLAGILPDLADAVLPAIDAEGARLWWEGFVRATPMRVTQSPTNIQAADMIAAELNAMGYETRTIFYRPATGDETQTAGIRTVVGIKPGTEEPDHVLAWVAHYDSNVGTIYAAYDDGSGVAVALELARVLADQPTRKTIMPIFFDAEEIGLVASDYFVRQVMQDPDTVFDLVIGHDMTGINCPGHEWKMYQFTGENFAADLVPIETELYANRALFTEEEAACVEILDVADRNSDERRFKEAGIPVIRMAGGRKAVDYPEYHRPGDTVEYVYEFAGGEENYELGLALTVKASYWNVVAFDRMPRLEGGIG